MNELTSKVTELATLQAQVDQMIAKLNEDLFRAVRDNPMEGVTKIPGDLNAGIVSISTILGTPGRNLSASYYLSESQAEAVKERISSCTGVEYVFKAVREMIADGKVRNVQNVIILNERTKDLIRQSELGQAALTII